MKISYIEHVGIAVKSIEKSLHFYEKILGLKCCNVEVVHDQKVKTACLKIAQTKIELLEPTSENSIIAKFIKKYGEGIHHIAFAVPNVKKALIETMSNGVQVIDKIPRQGAENLSIGFLHPKYTQGVLIELCSCTSDI